MTSCLKLRLSETALFVPLLSISFVGLVGARVVDGLFVAAFLWLFLFGAWRLRFGVGVGTLLLLMLLATLAGTLGGQFFLHSRQLVIDGAGHLVGLLHVTRFILVCLLFYLLAQRVNLDKIVYWLVITCGAVALVVVIEFAWSYVGGGTGMTNYRPGGVLRASGFMANPNYFGFWYAFVWLVGLGYVVDARHQGFYRRPFYLLSLVLILPAVVLSGSRGVMLALALTGAAMTLWLLIDGFMKGWFSRQGAWRTLAAMVALALFVAAIYTGVIRVPGLGAERLADIFVGGGSGRMARWSELWTLFVAADPILKAFGHGLGQLSAHGLPLPHNGYLLDLFERGLVFAGLFYAALLALLIYARYRASVSGLAASLAFVLLALTINDYNLTVFFPVTVGMVLASVRPSPSPGPAGCPYQAGR